MDQKTSFNGVQIAAALHKNKFLKAFSRVIDTGVFLEGKENRALARSLGKMLGAAVIPVASGHDALLLALDSLHLEPDDEVVVPANAYPTAFPVVLSGANLVLSDVDENGQMDPVSLVRAITKKTAAVILVHLYGLVGDVGAVMTLCQKYRISLIEDCAQAFGATWRSQPVGTIGDIGCFSFYPTKNLGASGDGGAILTKDKRIASFIRQAKQYGETVRYESQFIAGHSRLPELQAAGLRDVLGSFPKKTKQRQMVYEWYKKAIKVSNIDTNIRLFSSHPSSTPAPHLLVIETKQRDKVGSYLTSQDIPTAIHYPHPIHLVPAFSFLEKKRGDFPVAERLANRILSLPFHEYLTKQEIKYTVNSIESFFSLPA